MSEVSLMTTSEVAHYFGISNNTVTKWVKQGRLPLPFSRGQGGNSWFRESIEKAADYLRADLERNLTYFNRKGRKPSAP